MTDTGNSLPAEHLAELAQLILRHEGFVNLQAAAGTLLACDGRVWRYQEDELVPATIADYERAFDRQYQADWPSNTISFSCSEWSPEQTLRLDIELFYSCGIDPDSRGGSSSIWRVQRQPSGWRVLAIEAWMDSD